MASKAQDKQSKAKAKPSQVAYTLGKGTPRILDIRLDREEVALHVNGAGMLYSSARVLTSLDLEDGATFQAWKKLASALKCTSYCGYHGKTTIPIEIETSRIGTCLRFSMGPMSMYSTAVVLRPRKRGGTMRATLDSAFGIQRKSYTAVIVPEAATGHMDHDASIFDPNGGSGDSGHHHGHEH
ncbi:MAG: hypothetical protein AAGC67_02250 [Myxococcota bacterium]